MQQSFWLKEATLTMDTSISDQIYPIRDYHKYFIYLQNVITLTTWYKLVLQTKTYTLHKKVIFSISVSIVMKPFVIIFHDSIYHNLSCMSIRIRNTNSFISSPAICLNILFLCTTLYRGTFQSVCYFFYHFMFSVHLNRLLVRLSRIY